MVSFDTKFSHYCTPSLNLGERKSIVLCFGLFFAYLHQLKNYQLKNMRNISLIILAFGLLTISMQNSSQVIRAIDYHKAILGTWYFEKVEFVFDSSTDPEEKEFIEMFMIPMLEEGLSYVQMSFYEDGTIRTVVDSPDENVEDVGQWQLSADGRTLITTTEGVSEAQNVLLLTNTNLVLSVQDEEMQLILHLKKI